MGRFTAVSEENSADLLVGVLPNPTIRTRPGVRAPVSQFVVQADRYVVVLVESAVSELDPHGVCGRVVACRTEICGDGDRYEDHLLLSG